MDEIDKVVDNLFNQYIPKNKDVAPVPSEPPPSTAPETDPELDTTSSLSVANHPDIIQKPTVPHPDIIKKPAASPPKQKAAGVINNRAQQAAVVRKPGRKKAAIRTVPVNIAEIKTQTAKMLRHLHKAIKSENWWHKLYYANKFLFLAVSISKTITKREKA